MELCEIDCGIFSNADFLSKKYTYLIPEKKRNEFSIKEGNGIFILIEEKVKPLLPDDPQRKIIKRTYKNSDIDRYFIDTEKDIKYLLYIDDSFEPKNFPRIVKHLEKFKEVLSARLERYGEKYPWWRLHRPHKKSIYEKPKIVTSRWGTENYYAIQEGNFFENSDINLYIPKKETKESLEYILALLNSKLLSYWMKYKGRGKGVSRQIRLKKIPIRRINFNDLEEVKAHNEIVDKVKSIREKMTELSKYSRFFICYRLTRLKSNEPLPKTNNEVIIKNISSENIYNIRTHPKIKIEKINNFNENEFYFSKIEKPELILTGDARLKIKGKNKTSLFIEGPYELLKLLYDILPNWKNKAWSEIKENILFPDNIISFNIKKANILNEVQNIRLEILNLQKKIDQIIYKLYDLDEREITSQS